jgi:hypothetical protein
MLAFEGDQISAQYIFKTTCTFAFPSPMSEQTLESKPLAPGCKLTQLLYALLVIS